MREIKFRAWDTDRKIIIHFDNEEMWDTNWMNTDQIMQFTGLQDKNGKGQELYHKDLIINYSRNDGKPHSIEWSDKLGAWVGSYRGLEYLINQELHEIEKVGNVFENPKLIEIK